MSLTTLLAVSYLRVRVRVRANCNLYSIFVNGASDAHAHTTKKTFKTYKITVHNFSYDFIQTHNENRLCIFMVRFLYNPVQPKIFR